MDWQVKIAFSTAFRVLLIISVCACASEPDFMGATEPMPQQQLVLSSNQNRRTELKPQEGRGEASNSTAVEQRQPALQAEHAHTNEAPLLQGLARAHDCASAAFTLSARHKQRDLARLSEYFSTRGWQDYNKVVLSAEKGVLHQPMIVQGHDTQGFVMDVPKWRIETPERLQVELPVVVVDYAKEPYKKLISLHLVLQWSSCQSRTQQECWLVQSMGITPLSAWNHKG